MSRHEQYGPDCRDFRNSMKDSLLLKEMYFSKRITFNFFKCEVNFLQMFALRFSKYVIFYFIEQVNLQENPLDSIKDSSESSNELPLLFFMIFPFAV